MTHFMQPDAQIICRKTDYGPVCKWEGGQIAEFNTQALFHVHGISPKCGMVVDVGRLRVRVIQFPVFKVGMPYDTAYVMLESPHAQLFWFYREKAEQFIRVLASLEARIWGAWRGLMLRPSPEGERLRLTGRIADWLL